MAEGPRVKAYGEICYMVLSAEGQREKALKQLDETDSSAEGPCVKAYGNPIHDSQVLRDHE